MIRVWEGIRVQFSGIASFVDQGQIRSAQGSSGKPCLGPSIALARDLPMFPESPGYEVDSCKCYKCKRLLTNYMGKSIGSRLRQIETN